MGKRRYRMIKLALVAGPTVGRIADSLEGKDREFNVVMKYERIDQLWDDIFSEGSSSFVDIDKIIVIQNGFMSKGSQGYVDQVLNLQSAMDMNNLRSSLYFVVNDTELYQEMNDNKEDFINYRNFNMLVFKEINLKVFGDVAKGKYDAKGLYHPDFLKRNEIDALLEGTDDEEEEEFEEEEVVETFEEFADSEENQKALKRQEIEDKKAEEEAEKERIRQEKLEKKRADDLLKKEKAKKPKKRKTRSKRKGILDLYRGVIAVTGDRQSGVSTTVANMSEVYASNGNSVLIIDLDIKRRFQTVLYKSYEEAIQLESRVAHGLLVSLINPRNLEEVAAVVSDNIALLSISQDIERDISRFANRPFDKVFSGAGMVNLLSFAKSMFDVVILDMPFESVKQVGECLSYVDKVITCVPNTEYHLDQFIGVNVDELLNNNEISANTLMSKNKLLLTKYNNTSKMYGKEMTEEFIMNLLSNLEESIYHLEVVGRVPYTESYEKQFERGNKIVNDGNDFKEYFEDFMDLV